MTDDQKRQYADDYPEAAIRALVPLQRLVMPHPRIKALRAARGKRFGDLTREVYADVAPQLAEHARTLCKARGGEIKPLDVMVLARLHGLRAKWAFEWLEEEREILAGSYSRIRSLGFRVMDTFDVADMILERVRQAA
jgi:hypothetical protein